MEKRKKKTFKKWIPKVWKKYSFFILLGAFFVLFAVVGFSEKFLKEIEGNIFSGDFSRKKDTFGKIVIISVEGVILSSDNLVKYLSDIEKNDKIVGVILRIDSPGGAVAPVQEIYEKLLRIREKKTIYSSVASLAASGGYYVASASDKIFVNKGSIVGSIGVIFQYFRYDSLLQKIGVEAITIKSGEHKDIFSAYRAMNAEEKKIIQDLVNESHEQFVIDIAKGRGVDYEDIAPLADGRIFSGETAKSYDLIDEIGDLDTTIEALKESLDLDNIEIVYPSKKWLDRYFDDIINSSLFQTLRLSLFSRGLVAVFPF